jgi:DNA transposition AAA+ family ATPase
MSTVRQTPVAEQLSQFIAETGTTQIAIARALGKSSTVISQYLSGTYPGAVKEIDAAVSSFLERQTEKRTTPKRTTRFVKTTVAKKIAEVARLTHLECEIGVIAGDAGLGKTIAVQEYARRNPGVILIEADLGYTAKTLFSELHRAVGYDGRGGLHDLFSVVVQKLHGSDRMIIVDEAEHLPYRALEMLRRVYDKAGVGVLLVGMPRLVSNLKGRRSEYAQLYSRVGVAAKLTHLTEADTTSLVASIDDSAVAFTAAYHESSGGNARVLSKLVHRSMRIAEINHIKLSKSVIERTADMLIL